MELLNSILSTVKNFDQLDEATKHRVYYNASLIVVSQTSNTANQAVQKALKKEVIDNLDGLDFNALSNLIKIVKHECSNSIRN